MNGTYQGTANMIRPPQGTSGKSGARIIIRALNDGQVLLDGQHVNKTLYFQTNSWFLVEGINFRYSVNQAVDIHQGSHNNIIRRVVAWQAPTDAFPFMNRSGQGVNTNNLVEDSAFFGGNRKACGQLSTDGGSMTWRRVWCRWQGSFTIGPKIAATHAYGGDNIPPGTTTISDNLIATWTGEDGCDDGRGCYQRYGIIASDGGDKAPNSKNNIRVSGSLAYLKPGAQFADHFDLGAVGHSSLVDGVRYVDTVSYVAGYTVRAFALLGSPTGKVDAHANNIIGIGGNAYTIGADWQGSRRYQGATLNDVPNPYNGITDAQGKKGPLCFRYENGVKTNTPLWPWPMDQRIKDAIALAGSSPLAGDGTVTGEVESLLGPIPDQCRQ
jgi:hypothetical protein